MPWADSLQLAPFTLAGAVGMSLLPYAPSHPHSHPVTSFFPSTAVLRRGGHNLGRQRHNHSIPVGGQLTWAPASWFLLSVHSLLCHSSLTRMQLALSFHMSQRERGGLFFWFINITKYGSCDTLFKVGQMQDRASVLEELARPSYHSSMFWKIISIYLEKRIKNAWIPLTCQFHLLTSQLLIQECNFQESDGTWFLDRVIEGNIREETKLRVIKASFLLL